MNSVSFTLTVRPVGTWREDCYLTSANSRSVKGLPQRLPLMSKGGAGGSGPASTGGGGAGGRAPELREGPSGARTDPPLLLPENVATFDRCA